MYKDPIPWDRINSFALVTYIPEPLAGFLDRLREELVPNCFLRAHITLLPPRPLLSPEQAWTELTSLIPRFTPFEIRLSEVEVFPVSDVIYIGIGSGSENLHRIHDALGDGALRYQEQFEYHPHVTLAQELKPDELDELVAVARARWAEYKVSKGFCVEKAVFVQNTRRNQWVDLGACTLGRTESETSQRLTGLLAE